MSKRRNKKRASIRKMMISVGLNLKNISSNKSSSTLDAIKKFFS